jgi:diguanylate cyclase (GGDEF)-like protein
VTSTTQPDPHDETVQFVHVESSPDENVVDIEMFASSQRLPTLPEIALRLVEIAQQEEPDYQEVSRIIRSDPVISGKILKTVNSALFGFRQRIETIEQAIPKLGITLLRTLILSFHLARQGSSQPETQPIRQLLWRSSLTQAVIAELIAEQTPAADPPTYFLAGMLQDIGILAMVAERPEEYSQHVLNRAQFPDVASAERAYFGFSHSDVSKAILERWRMGETFGGAVARHHDRVVPAAQNHHANRLTAALQAASMGASLLSSKVGKGTLDSNLRQWCGFLQSHFSFSYSQAQEIFDEIKHRVDEYSAIFSFQIGGSVRTDDILYEAKSLLQEIALKNQLELIEQKSPSRRQKSQDDAIYRDSLCGLYNRRFMDEQLNDQIERCIQKRKPIGCLFMDVDRFKSINDTYGHAAGDLAIQHVANWLNDSLRKNDLAFRLGGDEFIVVLQQVSEKEFEKIAHRIASQIPELKLENGQKISISLSVGGSYYQPHRRDVADINWLLDQSDQSMYAAKKQGGSTISLKKFVGKN